MKYIDIKDLVVDTTNNLSTIPGSTVWEVLTWEWAQYLPSTGAPFALPDIAHPRIECTTHMKFNHVDGDSWLCDYRVCRVSVDSKAAFFFVAREDCEQPTIKTFVLDMDVVKVFLGLIVHLAIEASTASNMYSAELVDECEEVYTYEPVEGRLIDRPLIIN